MTSYKIAIVDDDPAVRDSLEILLHINEFPAQSYPDGEMFLQNIEAQNWLAILLDVRMPGRDGLEILSVIKKSHPNIPVIIMSGHADVAMAVRALKNGALDFFEKPFQASEVLSVIGNLAANPPIQSKTNGSPQLAQPAIQKLTRRENEIATCLTEGMANKVIAHELGISVRTVETHRAHIMSKLGIKSLSELIRMMLAAE